MSNLTYIKEFIKDKKVASIMPTSSFAVKKAFKLLDFPHYKIVVEYGPGEGAFTRRILKRLSTDAQLIAIETNEQFVKELKRISDKRLVVVHDSAENILDILQQNKYPYVDCVISGIPFTFLKKNQRVNLVHNTRLALGEDGTFLVYQNSFYAIKYLEKEFSRIDKSFEPRNIPPLFIMKCQP